MLVVFNPTGRDLRRTIPLDLYYTGLTDDAVAAGASGELRALELDRFSRTVADIGVPAGGMIWYAIR